MLNAVKSVYSVQHIHINLTLIHCTFYRHTDGWRFWLVVYRHLSWIYVFYEFSQEVLSPMVAFLITHCWGSINFVNNEAVRSLTSPKYWLHLGGAFNLVPEHLCCTVITEKWWTTRIQQVSNLGDKSGSNKNRQKFRRRAKLRFQQVVGMFW